MSCRPVHAGTDRGQLAAGASALALLLAVLPTAVAVSDPGTLGTVTPAELEQAARDHLVLSELVTGGGSASDEFVELYNPAPVAMPIDGLELIYVTASGATITRKAAWPAGAPAVPPGGHVLIANEAGVYAAIADLTYVNGLAVTGGSLALRMTSVASAIDAVGWGTAASTWLEGAPAPAPAAGHSLERLPGGAAGSTQDTDQNALDFVERDVPDPQNGGSTPVPSASPQPSGSIEPTAEPTPEPTPAPTASSTPSSTPVVTATPDPTPTATFAPTPTPTTTPAPTSVATPTPAPQPLSIAEARALPDGSRATITGVSLTDGTFADGGGYVVDVSGGIAVLVSDGTFPRGVGLRVSGNLDDRYSQRTLRATAADVVVLGAGTDPPPLGVATGAIAEPVECRLVVISGAVASSPTTLSGGLGYDLDDGSGAVRVFVGTATGIDTSAWVRGATIMLTGVVGQRDTTGSGAAGYRVQPRDAVDIEAVAPPPTPSPTPTPGPSEAGSPTPGGSASASPVPSDPSIVPIADARRAATGTQLRVRGVVTLASGVSEPGSAVVQDGSGGILIRLGDEAGTLARGELVELVGARSTKAGMASLRVSRPPLHLGRGAQPDALRRTTGGLGEAQEALLVVVRGAIGGKLLRTSAGNVYFDLDDGSGPTRVFLSPRAAVATHSLVVGAWIEVAGVLGQETTGQQPSRGYRLWPRDDADVTILARPIATEAAAASGGPGAAAAAGGGGAPWPSGGAITLLTPPRLARAVPTASPVPLVVGPAGATLPARESQPAAEAALLLLLAGLMVATAAGLAAEPGLLDRLRSSPASEEIADGGDGARTDPVGEAATRADPVRLVPLGVLDDTPPRTQTRRASRQDGGRILPPT